jgi:hypothetical protein
MSPESLIREVSEFLAGSRSAVVIENGALAFDLADAKYNISGEHNKCLLHLWSTERNVVRRVLEAEVKNETLHLAVQRMGQSKPNKLEICRERDRRSSSARRLARIAYLRKLQCLLERRYPGFVITRASTAMDLEQSFSPIYARALIRQGQSAFAVLGVNDEESQGSIDAALTFGILWLDACRASAFGKHVVEGLKLFLPPGTSAMVRERMSQLNPAAAKWQLFEYNQAEDNATRIDIHDRGNMATRLVHLADEDTVHERFATAIQQVRDVMPEAEIGVLSPTEIAFRCHGLEFARGQICHDTAFLRSTPEIVFGLGAEQQELTNLNYEAFASLLRGIGEVRHAEGPRDHTLWRLHPERWLESLVARNVSAIDDRMDARHVYVQVPAFAASDRAMMDVLTLTHDGRLAVVELKADEDINLPLQGLDYLARVEWHHARGEFQRGGYFPGMELAAEKPLLFLVAPALRIHPSTDAMLRYFSPAIEWTLVGIDERWRENVRVVFRKRPAMRDTAERMAEENCA